MQSINSTINKNGFKFLDNDKTNLNSFIKDVNKIIEKYFANEEKLKNLSFNNFNKIVYKAQQEINKKHNPVSLIKRYNQLFKKEFLSNNIYIQHYFYLRAIRPQNYSKK